jgi:hypothetical protein
VLEAATIGQRKVAVHFTGVMEPEWTRKLNIEIRKLRQMGGTMENYEYI